MTENINVLIVGAGPTGLTLAVDLARRGVTFRIVDQATEPSGGAKGKGLQPRTLEVFDDLGVVDRVLATGNIYPPLRVRIGAVPVWRGRMHKLTAASEAVPYPMVIMHPQWRTEQVLRDRLAELGGMVEFGAGLTGFEQDAKGVTATLATGEVVRADYLVAADGGRSSTRKALGVTFAGETREGQRMQLGDVRMTGVDRDRIHVWVRPGKGMLSLFPMAGTDTFQLMASLRPNDEPDLTLAGFRRLVAERSMLRRLRVTEVSWASLYRVNIRMAERFRVGRVFLAGDAAHVHSPAGGQGLNTGVQDAYNLGWKLARVLAGAPEELLDTYEEERLPVAAHILGLSTDLLDKGTVKRGTNTKQLQLTYRGGSLARQGGDRVPDARLRLADGTRVRVFDLLRGPHFTLLSTGPAPALPGRPDVHVHELAEPYGDERYVLVRPDGYIGIATSSPADLTAYLAKV